MHVEKAKKRIAKQVKKGGSAYPRISIEYFGEQPDLATSLVVTFILEEGAEAQEQRFVSELDAREDETIQTTLVKIIERANAKTVTQAAHINVASQ